MHFCYFLLWMQNEASTGSVIVCYLSVKLRIPDTLKILKSTHFDSLKVRTFS